jgi:hypothetical protein
MTMMENRPFFNNKIKHFNKVISKTSKMLQLSKNKIDKEYLKIS